MWDEQLVSPLDPGRKPTTQEIEDEGQGFMDLLGMVQSGAVKHASTG